MRTSPVASEPRPPVYPFLRTNVNRLTPVPIGIGTAWAEVTTGTRDVDGFGFVTDAATTCARDTSGKVSCWGDNASGLLGDGWHRVVPVVPIGRAITEQDTFRIFAPLPDRLATLAAYRIAEAAA